MFTVWIVTDENIWWDILCPVPYWKQSQKHWWGIKEDPEYKNRLGGICSAGSSLQPAFSAGDSPYPWASSGRHLYSLLTGYF